MRLLCAVDDRHTLLVSRLWVSYREDGETEVYNVEAENCWMLVRSDPKDTIGGNTP